MKWFAAIAVTIVAAAWIIARLPVTQAALEPPIGDPTVGKRPGNAGRGTPLSAARGNELALFAQGCFWGVEERFRRVPGVVATAVGYTGGHAASPTYEQVSNGGTGHAEAVLVEFDPARVPYEELLRLFWFTHDPTTRDRQGPDHGPQYRSAIFTFSSGQHAAALASRDAEQRALADPITTEVAAAGPFWIAEEEHQQWDEKHGRRSCPSPMRARRAAAAPAVTPSSAAPAGPRGP